ncbi:unnamed protein product [Lactuca saligna]|uniref:TIR domain-containing protein n=1 Tax=Lactuca saligna TaxID=75948 RepID=A0AA35YE07_LACSI|nr:unnamed protein product [Lactuca saligna]
MVVLSELSEASSSSSSTHGHRYDVFLSFRGLDTRNNFTAYLHKALMDSNVITFLDDEEIEIGGNLKPELESAIKASRASVIVLSKNYASSTWCLDELVLILEQLRTSKHIVIPIFYHVEPTHVRKQQSSFGDAMAKHRKMMEAETDGNKRSKWTQKIERWNKALTQVADLKGKDVRNRLEMEFIEEIVNDIYRRLQIPLRTSLPLLIGMGNSVNFITSWLKDASSHTTDILTILGMGGIGKTTLAKYVYLSHFHDFDTSSYIEDISRRCTDNFNGLLELQKQLCDDILKTSSVQLHDVSVYTSKIESALARKKVFLVLDDIDSLHQLDALLGNKGFHPGSKIIITTKDAWLTESCALFKKSIKPKHAKHLLRGLYDTASQNLFCFHAFMCNTAKAGYEEVSERYVKYCEGHPLALEVLGKSLHNRDLAYWEDGIKLLKKETGSPINNVLRMSFDSLTSKNNKELFKHIACFFVGMDKDVTETILNACEINTRSGITDLIDRCLLSIGRNNKLMMHQLLQEMGRFVVREESPDKPWKRSRLWGHESFKALKKKKGKGNLIGLSLDMQILEKEKLHESFELKTDALSNMDNLMLLQLNYLQISGSYDNFPEELRWLCMHGFPLKSIPSDLLMENLVALDMSYSNIESFNIFYRNPQRLESRQNLFGSYAKDKRFLGSLKILNLSFCEQLCSLGGFDQVPLLERLILTDCICLIDVCESIERCSALVLVDLSYCNKLEKLPRIIGMLNKVKTLLLEGCNLGKSGTEIIDIDSPKMFMANNIDINTITSSYTILEAIPSHSIFFSVSLPRSLVILALDNNNLSTESFPMDFSYLSMLKELYLDENPIVSLPCCVRTLPRLEKLSMENRNMLTSVEHPPHTLTYLNLSHSSDYKLLLHNVVFDPQMSPIEFLIDWKMLAPSSFEIQGLIKIQPLAGAEENVLCRLGWSNLDFLSGRRLTTYSRDRGYEESEIQMYYEFGIFSTIYEGEEIPNWITNRSMGPSISFTIPSSPNSLTGLNFCCVMTFGFVNERLGSVVDELLDLPMITINNITKNLTWIYHHYIERVSVGVDGKCLTLLSHWMFGMNEMEAGDHITITVREKPFRANLVTRKCGVGVVYDDGDTYEEQEKDDVLVYYKSWNYVIGGDLTGFQLTTGEYLLNKSRIMLPFYETILLKYDYFFGEDIRFKDKVVYFRA